MSCPAPTELQAKLDGIQGEYHRLAAKRHLKVCPHCKSRMDALSQIKGVLAEYFNHTPPSSREDCPNSIDLVAYVEGRDLAQCAVPSRVAQHIEQCEACAEWTAYLRYWLESPRDAFPRTPRRLKSKAREMIPAFTLGWVRPRYAIAATAVACLALLVTVQFRQQTGTLPPSIQIGPMVPPAETSVPPTQTKGQKPGATAPIPPRGESITTLRGPGGEALGSRRYPYPAAPLPPSLLRGPATARPTEPVFVTFRYGLHGAEVQELAIPFGTVPILSSKYDYSLRVRPNQDGWLYVFQVDSRGGLVQLFPSTSYGTLSNPLLAGRDYSLPTEHTWFYLDETAGTETILVAFSNNRAKDWEDLYRRFQSTHDPLLVQSLTEDLQNLASLGLGGRGQHRACVVFRFQHESSEDH